MSHAATAPAAASAPAVRTEKLPPWIFYGILFGFLGAASIILWGPIGVSGTYPRVIGEFFRAFDPSYADANPYLVKMGSLIKPESFLVLGLLIGGFIAARTRTTEKAPAVEMIHDKPITNGKRYWQAFLGGVLIIFGARVAGGCTSGHIISGMTQLSLSGFVFAAGVFASGILSAKMLHGRRAAGV
jgi:uncharacterized membrane protein YedE/YeeE